LAVLNPTFTPPNALAALLTAESLLFAATTVGVALSSGGAFGVNRMIPPRAMAFASTTLLTFVAFGAATAWWDIYSDSWPDTFTGLAQAACILIAIVAQPLFAAAIALNLRS
jgi:hypothetical protein